MNRPNSKHYGAFEEWVEALPAQGRYSFTRDEVMSTLCLTRKAFVQVARRLLIRKRIARVHGKFYVVVPLEQAAVGIISADWFIKQLMEHLGRDFYVGCLSAAQYHGAAHQRPQWYHVVTDRPLRDISCRGVGIRFFTKRHVDRTPVQQVKVVTGYIPVSTPEVTALDLIRYSRRVGGLDHIFTVLQELGEVINPKKLVRAAESDGNVTYAQRLGWLLERAGYANKAQPLACWVTQKKPCDAKLEPSSPISGSERSERWYLRVNSDVEGDLE